jgi:hypothetical protein
MSWLAWLGLTAGVAAWSVVIIDRIRANRPVDVEPGQPKTAAIRWIIFLAWAYSVVPPFVGLLQLGRQQNPFGTSTTVTATQSHLSTALSIAVAFLCFRLILIHLRDPPSAPAWRLGVFLGPWLAIEVVSAVHAGYLSGRQFVLYPLIAIAFWLASPPLRVVTTLAGLTIVTAAFSLIFAAVSSLALVNVGQAGTDKAIISSGPKLLAGPYNHSNSLGLSLALGAASVASLGSRRLRIAGFVLIASALLWASSRTSLLAAAAMLTVYYLSRGRPSRFLRATSAVAMIVGAILVVFLPLNESNPAAFSHRGIIWITSLSRWHEHLWFGLGPQYYERPNNLGFYALYGHNLLVDTLARGGLIALASVTIWLAMLMRASIQLAVGALFPVMLLVAIVYVSVLEVPLAFNNLGVLGYASWVPLAVIAFTRDASQIEVEEPAIALHLERASTVATQ